MHGRKKSTQPPSQREIDAIKKKISTYQTLVGIAFEKRRSGDMSAETLDLTGKLLGSFPDFYSMWNYRREILIHTHAEALGPVMSVAGVSAVGGRKEDRIPAAVGGEVRDKELALSAECIQKNPKSCMFAPPLTFFNFCFIILIVIFLSLLIPFLSFHLLPIRLRVAPPQVGPRAVRSGLRRRVRPLSRFLKTRST